MSTLIIEITDSGPIARRVRSVRGRTLLGYDIVREGHRFGPDEGTLTVAPDLDVTEDWLGTLAEAVAVIDNQRGPMWLNHGEHSVTFQPAAVYAGGFVV